MAPKKETKKFIDINSSNSDQSSKLFHRHTRVIAIKSRPH